jgi:hypothetical protein
MRSRDASGHFLADERSAPYKHTINQYISTSRDSDEH